MTGTKSRTILFIAASSLMLGASSIALAESTTTNYTGATALELRDFIATVDIVSSTDNAISVTIDNGTAGKEPLRVKQSDGRVVIYSEDEPDSRNFWKKINWNRNGDNAFRIFLEDYPKVQIQIPEGTDIEADGVASYLNIGNTNGDLKISSTIYVEGSVGNLKTADVHVSGAGDMVFGTVAEALRAKISGSGSLSFISAADADLGISGSGDIIVKNIDGDANAKIRGSGDIELGDIAGATQMDISGSGDIKAGKITNGLSVSIRGSGDVVVDEINGPSSVAISGNGDVEIKQGRAEDMKVSIRGSGDLEFNGLATNPDVTVSGSGDIFIKDYEGNVRTRGDGDITIGNIVIDD